jgi:hypothetical protein
VAELAKAQCRTIRTKLLKIGLVVRRSTRMVYISFSEAFPFKNIFTNVIEKIALIE